MSLAGERRKSEVFLFAAADSLEILKNAADSFPFLSIATGITLAIVQKLINVNENKDRCHSTAERVAHVFMTIVDTFTDVDPDTVPSQTARNVEQLQHRLNRILRCVDKITRKRRVTRFFMAKTITADLDDLNAHLDDCLQLFQISSLVSIQYLLERYTGQLAEDATVISRKELDLHDSYEIHRGPNYSICTGTRGGDVVAIKSFVGPYAKQRWKQSLAYDLKAMHSNVATLIGTSAASDPNPYSVYGNISGSFEQQLAISLGRGLRESVEACIRMIHGIAAGLLYLDSQGIPVTKIGIHNIRVFSGNNSRAVLAIEWEADEEFPEDIDHILLSRPIDVLDALNIRVFQEANHIVHDDWVSSPSETSKDLELVSAGASEAYEPSQTPRSYGQTLSQRGLVWRTSDDNTRLSLSDVYQEAKRLDVRLRARSSPAPIPPRYRHHSTPQFSPPSRNQEELIFSARVNEYMIVRRDVWVAGLNTGPTYYPLEAHRDMVHSDASSEEGMGPVADGQSPPSPTLSAWRNGAAQRHRQRKKIPLLPSDPWPTPSDAWPNPTDSWTSPSDSWQESSDSWQESSDSWQESSDSWLEWSDSWTNSWAPDYDIHSPSSDESTPHGPAQGIAPPAWRNVPPRTKRKKRPSLSPLTVTTSTDWATWNPDVNAIVTPPSVESAPAPGHGNLPLEYS